MPLDQADLSPWTYLDSIMNSEAAGHFVIVAC